MMHPNPEKPALKFVYCPKCQRLRVKVENKTQVKCGTCGKTLWRKGRGK